MRAVPAGLLRRGRGQAGTPLRLLRPGRGEAREASSFLETEALEGARVTYSWRRLEPEQDRHDFRPVRDDLAFLTPKGKRPFVQLQDVTFSASRINVPRYLLSDARYDGGADKQCEVKGEDEERAVHAGWTARRRDSAVQELRPST